jgi:hypothetical protein
MAGGRVNVLLEHHGEMHRNAMILHPNAIPPYFRACPVWEQKTMILVL